MIKLSEARYVIQRMRLPLPPNTVLVEDDGVAVVRLDYGDKLYVKFLDLTDRWSWEACVGPASMDARQFVDNWHFVVDQWHRMMAEKEAP